jgi:hypothetical protein
MASNSSATPVGRGSNDPEKVAKDPEVQDLLKVSCAATWGSAICVRHAFLPCIPEPTHQEQGLHQTDTAPGKQAAQMLPAATEASCTHI